MAILQAQAPWALPDPALVHVRDGGQFLGLIGRLDRFSGRWLRLKAQSPEQIDRLRMIATIQSAASSTRIEGAQLSDEQVRKVLAGMHTESFRSRDEQEVRGYRDLLEVIRENHATLRLTENVIKDFHRILLAQSEKDAHHRGEYKKQPNDVEKSGEGLPLVVFRTAPPAETRWWTERIVAEFTAAWDNPSWHRLVLIADFILWFLAIHPFLDGNGRLARALTQFLLLKAGYEYTPFASLERVIEDRKPDYYVSLQHSQVAVRSDSADYGKWLRFFLSTLDEQQQALEGRLIAAAQRQALPASQTHIIELISTRGAMTTPEIASALAMSRRTVRYHLAQLTAAHLLDAPTRTAGRRYSLPLDDLVRPTSSSEPQPDAAAPLPPAAAQTPAAELLTPLDFAGYPQQINSSPNGRTYATVVLVGSVDPARPPLGDTELDAFEGFCDAIEPTAKAVRATPEVGWWQLVDSPRLDKLQMWLYPGPLVQVHWALDAPDAADDGLLALDPVGLVVYWRHVLRQYLQLTQTLKITASAVALNVQTIPSGRPCIVDIDFSRLPTPVRSGATDSAPPPWTATRVNVRTVQIPDDTLLQRQLDQLLRHFSYRHTNATVDAALRLAIGETWDVSVVPTRVMGRRGTLRDQGTIA